MTFWASYRNFKQWQKLHKLHFKKKNSGTCNDADCFPSHISEFTQLAHPLFFFMSSSSCLGTFLKRTFSHMYVWMWTHTNSHPRFYVLSTFLPLLLETNGFVSKMNETNLVRDKSYLHYMNMSLSKRSAHMLWMLVNMCVCCNRDESLI